MAGPQLSATPQSSSRRVLLFLQLHRQLLEASLEAAGLYCSSRLNVRWNVFMDLFSTCHSAHVCHAHAQSGAVRAQQGARKGETMGGVLNFKKLEATKAGVTPSSQQYSTNGFSLCCGCSRGRRWRMPRVLKAVGGLLHARKVWYHNLASVLLSMGWIQS